MLFNKRVPRFLYETPEATPAAVTTPPPAPASPWAADAAAYFGDNAEATAAFDRYMREKQQPYVTQLEESTKDARDYYDDLQNDTDATLRALIEQRYGADFATEYEGLFAEPDPAPVTTPPAADEIPEWAKPLVESHQQTVDREAKEAQEANYAAFKDGLKGSHGLTDDDLGLIDPFIYGSAHDADAAVASYRAWQAKAGVAPAAAAEVPAPPPVLGGDGPAATPPLATKYTKWEDIGSAFENYRARQAASATPPPVVG